MGRRPVAVWAVTAGSLGSPGGHPGDAPPSMGSMGPSDANLVQGTDGNFYGTTVFGGDRSMNVNGRGSSLQHHANRGADDAPLLSARAWSEPGYRPRARNRRELLWDDVPGRRERTRHVLRMEPDGMLTTLRSFAVDAESPNGRPRERRRGSFYGTTTDRVFNITPTGTLTRCFGPRSSRHESIRGWYRIGNRWGLYERRPSAETTSPVRSSRSHQMGG